MIPEDINDLVNLLIEHYGEDYISSYEVLQELLFDEFEIAINIADLQRIRNNPDYSDVMLTLTNCGIEL